MAETGQPPATGGAQAQGWYADPWGHGAWRWWDGSVWTGWTSGAPQQHPYATNGGYASPAGVSAYPYSGWAPTAPPAPFAIENRPTAAPRPATVPKSQRRRLVAELLLVLAVFPLPYSLSALVSILSTAVGNGTGSRTPIIIKGHPGISFPIELVLVILPLVAAGLVWYLLTAPGTAERPSDGGLSAIGLDGRNLRGDLALLLGIFLLAFLLPIDGGGVVIHLLHIHVVTPRGGAPKYFTVIDVASGITAGIVEEIVVLGYLVRRLEQLGLSSWAVVALAVAVRGSYHVYYGWGVLPILVWATVSVLLYRRFRRLLPFMIVHALWDSSLFIAQSLNLHSAGIFMLAEAGILVPITFVLWIMWRHHIPARNTDQQAIGGTL